MDAHIAGLNDSIDASPNELAEQALNFVVRNPLGTIKFRDTEWDAKGSLILDRLLVSGRVPNAIEFDEGLKATSKKLAGRLATRGLREVSPGYFCRSTSMICAQQKAVQAKQAHTTGIAHEAHLQI